MAGTSDSGLQFETPQIAVPPVVKAPPVRRKRVAPPPAAPEKSAKPTTESKQTSTPQPPTPAKSKTAADDQQAPAAAGADKQASRYSWRFMPSWLVSLVIHLVLLVVLAIVTFTTQPKLLATIINGGFETEELPIEEVTEMKLLPLEDVQAMSADPGGGEALVTEAIEVGSEVGPGVAVSEGDLQLDSVSEVGGLFSGDGVAMKDSGSGALKGAEFFGVKATGKKFVFIVDSSNSMKNGKFDAAKVELEYAIRRLTPEQLFYVVFFDHDAEKMLLPPDTEPPTNVVPATYQNISSFVKWMGTVKNELKTNPYEAVKFALSLKPDAIYILSDGKFTDKGQTVRFLEKENVIHDPETGSRPRAIIHTIAFWQRDGEEAMQAIAKQHRGTYRFVPQPKK